MIDVRRGKERKGWRGGGVEWCGVVRSGGEEKRKSPLLD